MICPRCKTQNDDSSQVCTNCGLKLKTACPRCKTLNKIGQSVCTNCNLRLIRFCPQCKAPNFPNAPFCRKCNHQLLKPKPKAPEQAKATPPAQTPPAPQISREPVAAVKEIQKEVPKQEIQPQPIKQEAPISPQQPAVEQEQVKVVQEIPNKLQEPQNKPNFKEFSRAAAHEAIANALLKSEQGLIIEVNAPNGAGKSTLTSGIIQTLQQEKIIWLIGICQPLNQLLPFSFFQDLFKSLLGLPLFVSNLDESRVALDKIMETNIGISDPHINNVLRRILFNAFIDCSQDIAENKDELHDVIYKVLDALNKQAKLVLVIEDFEYIDNASLECIKYIVNKGFLNKKNFLLINHPQNMSVTEVFPIEAIKNCILTLNLKSMTPDEINTSLLGMLNNHDVLPPRIKNEIFAHAKDSPMYMEQILWYLFQTGALMSSETSFTFNPQAENIELPPTLDELIATRIKLIGNASPDALRIMVSASLFGIKFIPAFVQMIAQIEEQQFNNISQMLNNNGIFAVVEQNSVRFKHNWIWKVLYEQFFTEDQIVDCGRKLLEFYEKYTINTSNAILARHAEEALMKKETYIYYNLAIQESIYLGDAASFTDYQNKILELLPETELSPEQQAIHKIEIEEQLGRANYEYNPPLAIDYLSNSIIHQEKENNAVKIIDLTGYLARSCELNGDFSGVLECCDKALTFVEKDKNSLEALLLNYYKLESTLNLGRLEETIVNASNELLPELNKAITKNKSITGISVDDLKNIELDTEITLARAYLYQGNKQALELANNIILKAQKENKPGHEQQAMLIQALFYTIQGNSRGANDVLSIIKSKFEDADTPEKFRLYWYTIAVLSNLTVGNYKQANELCYTALAVANYHKEYNIATLIKLAMGKCSEEFGQMPQSYELYDDIVNYCSEHKMATGALFSWYLAANNEFKLNNLDRAYEIAERALEIALKPNINNYLAEILLNKLIAKIRTSKNDFEGAQINIETAINIAEKNDLMLCLVDLYVIFGVLYRHIAALNAQNAENNANVAYRLYSKALSFAEQCDNQFLISIAERQLTELNNFCSHNNLKLDTKTI